jgi:hypothetical protein
MKRSQQMTVAIAIATLIFHPIRPVQAQFTNPYTWRTWNNPISSSADTAIMNRAFQRMVGINTSSGSTSQQRTPAPKSAPLSVSTFKPVAKEIMPQKLAADANLNAKDQQEVAQLYSELLANYKNLLQENGEQRLQNNIAGAMMYVVLTSYYVLSNGEEISDAEQEKILQNVNATLAEDRAFLSMSAQAKQELYETLVISASFPLVLYIQGQDTGDTSLIAQAREMAQETFNSLSL